MKIFGYIEQSSWEAKTRKWVKHSKSMSSILKRIIRLHYSPMEMGKANLAKANLNRLKSRRKSITSLQLLTQINQTPQIISLINYFKCSINQKLITKKITLCNFMKIQISIILSLKTNGNQNNVNKFIRAMLPIYTNSKIKAKSRKFK